MEKSFFKLLADVVSYEKNPGDKINQDKRKKMRAGMFDGWMD